MTGDISTLQGIFGEWLRSQGSALVDWSIASDQPYCLNALSALSSALHDCDISLFGALLQGAEADPVLLEELVQIEVDSGWLRCIDFFTHIAVSSVLVAIARLSQLFAVMTAAPGSSSVSGRCLDDAAELDEGSDTESHRRADLTASRWALADVALPDTSGPDNEQEPAAGSGLPLPKLTLGQFSRRFRLWRRKRLGAYLALRLQQLRPLFGGDLEEVVLEDPSRTSEAVAAGHRLQAEAAALASHQRQQERVDMLFEVTAQLGHRLALAEIQIQSLQEARQGQVARLREENRLLRIRLGTLEDRVARLEAQGSADPGDFLLRLEGLTFLGLRRLLFGRASEYVQYPASGLSANIWPVSILVSEELSLDLGSLKQFNIADILLSLHRGDVHISNALKALRWAAKALRLRLPDLYGGLLLGVESRVLSDRKEALPLPIFILAAWERFLLSEEGETGFRLFIGGLLIAANASLRFSDCQHVLWSSLQAGRDCLRAISYRTKSSRGGMPFGLVSSGFYGDTAAYYHSWVCKYLFLLGCEWDHITERFGETVPDALFFLSDEMEWRPMSYAQALSAFRGALVAAGLSPHEAGNYTLHSLKTSLLASLAQLQVSFKKRGLQGHHRSSSNGCVLLYSRDDVHGALSLQQMFWDKVRSGWLPLTPQARGGLHPAKQMMIDISALPIAAQVAPPAPPVPAPEEV
ncbi:unnamed protein product, partial [Symbiodinium necroappetens]